MDNMIVLTKDNELYSKDVLRIIEFNKTYLIFVYKNNEVEYYSNKNLLLKQKVKYEKVLYTDNFVAILNKKHLYLYYLITSSNNCNLILDEAFDISFLEVYRIRRR